jgi:hypothetical protein
MEDGDSISWGHPPDVRNGVETGEIHRVVVFNFVVKKEPLVI